MRTNVPLVAGLAVVVIAMGVAAYRLGPPGGAEVTAGKTAAPPAPSAPSDREVTGFGPVPGCGDRDALDTVMGLLRGRLPVKQTGLANTREVGRNGAERSCSADVETANGQTSVAYTVTALSGKDNWRIRLTRP